MSDASRYASNKRASTNIEHGVLTPKKSEIRARHTGLQTLVGNRKTQYSRRTSWPATVGGQQKN